MGERKGGGPSDPSAYLQHRDCENRDRTSCMKWILPVHRNVQPSLACSSQRPSAINRGCGTEQSGQVNPPDVRVGLVELGAGLITPDEGEGARGQRRGGQAGVHPWLGQFLTEADDKGPPMDKTPSQPVWSTRPRGWCSRGKQGTLQGMGGG